MMTKEAFSAFCRGRHLTLTDMDCFFGIADEKLIRNYLSGALPIPEAVSEKIEEIIFSDVVDLPASSREEKLDQLLSVLNQLPHKGAAVHKRIQMAVQQAQRLAIDEKYLGYDLAFWLAFQWRFEKKCRAEELYTQGSLFAATECQHSFGYAS